MRVKTSRVLCVVAIAIASSASALGCGTVGGETFVRAYAVGDRDYSAGRYSDAAKDYQLAADAAERDRDRDEAHYAAGESLYRAGDVDGALAIWDALAAQSPPGERAIYAGFRAARLRIARGQTEQGYAALRALLLAAPEEGVAHRALRALVVHVEETEGKAAAIAYEQSLRPAAEGTRLGEEICYDVASRQEELGSANAALEGFLSCADLYPYPTGALFDDSLYRASLLHEQLGDAKAAVADLERLLAVRETSDINGTYDRPRMPPAQFRIGELQRDKLADHAAARASFQRTYDVFTKSALRPKALFYEALLAHEDGDVGDACALSSKLLDEFGDSRWARRADEACADVAPRVQELKDARAARRKKDAGE